MNLVFNLFFSFMIMVHNMVRKLIKHQHSGITWLDSLCWLVFAHFMASKESCLLSCWFKRSNCRFLLNSANIWGIFWKYRRKVQNVLLHFCYICYICRYQTQKILMIITLKRTLTWTNWIIQYETICFCYIFNFFKQFYLIITFNNNLVLLKVLSDVV